MYPYFINWLKANRIIIVTLFSFFLSAVKLLIMKTSILMLASVLTITLFSCCKESRRESQNKVFKGKYIANGCWPVMQIMEPLNEKFKDPAWLYGDSSYNYCVTSMEVTKKYQTGEPFRFKILEIKETIDLPSLHYCTSPKYMAVIEILPDTLTTN